MQQHDDVHELAAAVALLRGARVAALTGAGVSTESGIPDYRGPEASKRVRRPIQGPEFVRSADLRRRYWARAMVGWDRFRSALPGASHHALADLEAAGIVRGLVTQNVDRLHHVAGSQDIVELHGALAEVICLACGAMEERDAVQERMDRLNPGWLASLATAQAVAPGTEATPMAPDGDADLTGERIARFVVPGCLGCGGTLKPNVVFFGHNVAKPVVDTAFAAVDAADALLIAGTSLAVFSGYRFLLRAAERKIPIVVVNRGAVRGEERVTLKLEMGTGAALAGLARELGAHRPVRATA